MKYILNFTWEDKVYTKEVPTQPQLNTSVIFDHKGLRYLGDVTSIINNFINGVITVYVTINTRVKI